MIPKIIHYIWLGGKQKPNLINMCILSWRLKMPDYEIKEWNESNLDLDQIALENRFFAACRKRRMWAYMADYLRLRILYDYGGIYLDTDMQVIKSFDSLLNDPIFFGQENKVKVISCGCIGSHQQNPIILKVLHYYDEQIWHDSIWTIPGIVTKVLGSETNLGTIKIYPPEYFYPFPFQSEFKEDCITENTFAIHWWAGSWIGKLSPYLFLSTKHIHNPIRKFLITIKKAGGYYYSNWLKLVVNK